MIRLIAAGLVMAGVVALAPGQGMAWATGGAMAVGVLAARSKKRRARR